MRFLLTAVLSVAICSPAAAGAAVAAGDTSRSLADDSRVANAIRVWQEWVEYQAAIQGVPAVSVGIVHDQELLSSSAFGFANPASERPATADTLYSICSISKLFTSVAVMQQRDAGELQLDDPVSNHLDWFTLRDAHPGDGPITVRGLLTHSAGLPRESDFDYWTGDDFPFPTRDELRQRLGHQETLYPASRYHQYSNLGLSLAGEIVTSTSGESFDAYIQRHILDPLEMADTSTEVPVTQRGEGLAVGHSVRQRDGTRYVVAPFQARGIAPAAGFASNVPDLAKFASWQFRLLDSGGDEILRSSTLAEMHRVHWTDPDWKTTWGLGFVVSREGDRTFVSHSGGCPGYITSFRLEPKTKLGAIVLTSAIGAPAVPWSARAFDLVRPAVEAALASPDDSQANDPALDRYAGIYDSLWGQTAVVHWKGSLAILGLNTTNPAQALTELKKADDGENVFRVVRKDDGSLGEAVTFDVASDGAVSRLKRHSNWSKKVRR